MDERLRRLAENDGLFAQIDPTRTGELHDFVCECTELSCQDILHLRRDEYARVRTRGRGRFLVMPGHEDAGVELVVESHPRYLVVEPGSVVRGLHAS